MSSGEYRFLFGPVRSRRLGLSLGIDLLPGKVCSWDCPYCQVGATSLKTLERREYVPTADVLAEFDAWQSRGGRADCVTLAGSGEPTLHTRFGEVLTGVARRCNLRRVLLSNGTLFSLPEVRAAATAADVVKGTLSAWDEPSFRAMHRPHASLSFDAFYEGLRAMRRDFRGEYWIEVFVVPGINDAAAQMERIADLVRRIGPDRVHLNTAVRPPAEASLHALPVTAMEQLAQLFSPAAEIATSGRTAAATGAADSLEIDARLCALAERHPASAEDMASSLGLAPSLVAATLERLVEEGRLTVRARGATTFYASATPGAG